MTEELKAEIKELAAKKNAVILAHNYQLEGVQKIADYTGDSLGLSRKAAESEAEIIVFCGVDFMAESAAILAPEKKVLLPERNATCPLAEMVTQVELKEKKEQHPDATVVCYVNSSAAVKAESDVCCTSSNAVEIVNQLDSEEILFVPDENLGKYVKKQTDKEIIPWPGHCLTHHRVRPKDVSQVREFYPEALIAVHPECRPEVAKETDFVGSTAQILDFVQKTEAEKVIIGTEMGLIYRLKEENPDQEFDLLSQGLICKNMKITSLSDIKRSLEEEKHQIELSPQIREEAKKALDKMLALSS